MDISLLDAIQKIAESGSNAGTIYMELDGDLKIKVDISFSPVDELEGEEVYEEGEWRNKE